MFVPGRRIFAWRSLWTPRTSAEKQAVKEREQAGLPPTEEPSRVSLVLRVAASKDADVVVAIEQPESESFQETLDRLSAVVSSRVTKHLERTKRKKEAVQTGKRPTQAEYVRDTANFKVTVAAATGQILDGEPCLAALSALDRITLNGEEFGIVWLPYPIEGITTPIGPRIGHPLVPAVEYRKDALVPVDVSAATASLRIFWFVSDSSKALQPDCLRWTTKHGIPRLEVEGCEFREAALVYTPTERDIHKYMVVAVAQSQDEQASIAWAVKMLSPVEREEAEEAPLSQGKIDWCRHHPTEEKGLRVVSYNLLSDTYLNLSLKDLFYPFCPKQFQHMKYRYPALMKEIQAYSADLLFLQETCPRMGRLLLPPFLRHHGYQYDFSRKFAEVREGSLLAWKPERFEFASSTRLWLADLLQNSEGNADLRASIDGNGELKEIIMSRPTQIHIIDLRDRQEAVRLLCAITHLHHKPEHEHIKVVQMILARRAIDAAVEKAREQERGLRRVHVLLAADMNSTPDGPVYSMMESGGIRAEDAVWKAQPCMAGVDVQAAEGSCRLTNVSGCPPFTNYTQFKDATGEMSGFAGCIDYLWAAGLEATAVAPQPSLDDVTRHTALPSRHAPSDHLAIVANLRYTE